MPKKKDVLSDGAGILVGVGLAYVLDVLLKLSDPKEWTKFADDLNQISNDLSSTIQSAASADMPPTSTDSMEDPTGGVLPGAE